jgi:hypothetical protein
MIPQENVQSKCGGERIMDEQKETVTSFDPKTGQSKEVNVVLDHARNGGMKYSVEEAEEDNQKNSH